jgi:hypothetical protein
MRKQKNLFDVAYPISKGNILPEPKYSISNRSYTLYRLKGESIRWNGEQIVRDSKDPIVIGAIRGGSITGDIQQLGHELLEVGTDNLLLKLLPAKGLMPLSV